jgi:phosphate transport system substrate-binding protein
MRFSTTLKVGAMMLLVSCGRGPQQQMTIAGSTSIQPFAEVLAEKYMAMKPEVRVAVQGGGSTAGIQAVREGAAAIGTVSRELGEGERDLIAITIARDGIAVIVHPSNPLSDLTREQVRDVFAGTIRDFSAVGGKKGRIWPVTREEGSGTRGAFQELVMGKSMITPEALVQNSNGSVRELVANDPFSIGFISLGIVDKSVKAVSIAGVAATRENVKAGTYKLVRPFLFVLASEPEGIAKEFIEFVLSQDSQRLLEEEGLIGVH